MRSLYKPSKHHECRFIRDSDDDGSSDYFEKRIIGANPKDPNTDDDGLSDYFRIVQTSTCTAHRRDIHDGLSNGEEWFIKGFNPHDSDTDGDFWRDSSDMMPDDSLMPNSLAAVAIISSVISVAYLKRRIPPNIYSQP